MRLTFGLGGALFCVAGVIAIAVGVVSLRRGRRFIAQSLRATGTVIDIVIGGHIDILYFPVVRFQTLDGRNIEFKSAVGTSPSLFRTGQSVTVSYNPRNPQDAKINSGCLQWGGPAILLILGSGIFLLGLLLLLCQWVLNGLPTK